MGDAHIAAARARWATRAREPREAPRTRQRRREPVGRRPDRGPVREVVEPIDAVRPDGRRVVALVLPWQLPPVTLNHRLGWAALRRVTDTVREVVEWSLRDVEPIEGPVEVELLRYIGDEQLADADNLAALGKPCLDGCVRARTLPADDHSVVIRTTQRMIPGSADPLGPGHPRLVLVLAQADARELPQYGPDGRPLA